MNKTFKASFLAILLSITLLQFTIVVQVASEQEKEKLEFEILSCVAFPFYSKPAEIIVERLKDIGISLKHVSKDTIPFFTDMWDKRDFDFFVSSIVQGPIPTAELDKVHSRLDISPGGYETNHYGVHNSTLDKLLDEYPPLDREAAREKIRQADRIYMDILPSIPLFTLKEVHVIRKEYTGYVVMPGGPFYIHNPWTILNLHHKDYLYGGGFTMNTPRYPDTLNPLLAREHRSLFFINLCVYDTLLKYNTEFEFVPWLAKSWEVSTDRKTYTFHLIENATFHDGTPLTSADVKFTADYMMENKVPAPFIHSIESVEAPDPYTVMFHLKSPHMWFLNFIAGTGDWGGMPIIPKHIWEDKPYDWENPEPIGSGPFMWESRIPGEYIRLKRNPNYWVEGKPYLDWIAFQVVKGGEAQFMSVKMNETQTTRYSLAMYTPALISDAMKDPNLDVIETPDIWYVHMGINMRRPPLDDPTLRKAILYAIDTKELVDKALMGWGIPAIDLTTIPKEWHSWWYDPDTPRREYNVKKANEMLDKAGYTMGPDGVRMLPKPPAPEVFPTELIVAAVVIIAVIATVALYIKKRRPGVKERT